MGAGSEPARRRLLGPLLGALVLCGHRCAALTVDIAPGEQDCFILAVETGVPISGNFELIEPNDEVGPLAVQVLGPPGKPKHGDTEGEPIVIYESRGEVEGTFAFDASMTGEISLCLSNGAGTGGAGTDDDDDDDGDGVTRTVGFALRALDASVNGVGPGGEVATEEHVTALSALVTEFVEGLSTMVDHQSYMRQREERHRDITESTNAKVLWWTIAECSLLLLMSLWQIMYIRKFFEVRRYL